MAGIEPEETLSSEILFSGSLIDVRGTTVRLPDGKTTVREIVVHPEVVAVLPILDDGRLVFVRQYRTAAERVTLETPAGAIDEGETPEEAARREMIEETGYRVGALQLLHTFYTSPGFCTERMYLYKATQLETGEPTEMTDRIEVEILTLAEAQERVLSGEIVDAKSILSVMAAAAGGA